MSDHNRPLHRVLWTVLVLVIVGLCAALAVRSFRASERQGIAERNQSALPKIAPVGEFTLLDSQERKITEKDLLGKIWVAQFFFTECPGPCPAVSRQLTVLQSMVTKTPDVTLVSISIDPEHDTPAALRAYARSVGADPQRWLFLTGTAQEIDRLVARSFMIGFKENPKDQQPTMGRFVHSTKVALVDGEGVIRAYYDGLDVETPQKILADISTLLREAHRPTP